MADDLIFVSSGAVRGAGHFENVERTERRGLETAAEWRAGELRASGTYTWQRATFGTALSIASPFHPDAVDGNLSVDEGAVMPAVPSHVGRVTVSGPLGPRLAGVLSVRAQSSQVLRGAPRWSCRRSTCSMRLTRRSVASARRRNGRESSA